jgi:lipopolysaccharide/colanic/teichoic acid biosynthesis glycosyltransferase
MPRGLRHRVASAAGTVGTALAALWVANHPTVQAAVTGHVPVLSRLRPHVLGGEALALAGATTVCVVLVALAPLFKPTPRRSLDTAALALERVGVATLALAAVGYFDYTYRLPRSTLLVTAGLLAALVPAWLVAVRTRPREGGPRVVVGDDPGTIDRIVTDTDGPIEGCVCPPALCEGAADAGNDGAALADGGVPEGVDYLGGFARFEDVLVERGVERVVLGFAAPTRAEFFGVLDACHAHGVTVETHAERTDAVLTDGRAGDGAGLVEVDVEPWDWQDHVLKRAFDVCFALAGLCVLAPLMLAAAVAIRLDDGGPVFYTQERTTEFGGTFGLAKFRTMTPEGEDATPTDDATNDRITRVGRLLRRTHLDEAPQLFAVLAGRMSAVGPRAVWTEEERLIEAAVGDWRKRWFVKPGLTGLAQINGAKSTDPERKLRYDLAYIRRQSFRLDLRIVARQVWLVLADVAELVRETGGGEPDEPAVDE